jgi:L-seryl-tRNA(Ser) seleniumtransferase
MASKENYFKNIPSVDELLNKSFVKALTQTYSRKVLVYVIRIVLAEIRKSISKKKYSQNELSEIVSDNSLENKIINALKKEVDCGIKKVVNATGIILSTNLGRAVLCRNAVQALSLLDGYSSLEIDLETGDRGKRWLQAEKFLQIIVGAEAAHIVNNNAAATLVILNTLAKGKDVLVSRGQLIELGDSFRLPDIMAQSGCNLVEVGATNRTHLSDYEKAINENTALILHVHTSNYRIKGFTSSVSVSQLSELGKKHKLPVVDDLGAGAIIDFGKFGFKDEPTIQSSLADGADLVCSSTDKLIGGPQGGVIVGKKEFVERIRKNPLSRALRVGKLTLAVLEITLKNFLNEDNMEENIPVLKMLTLNNDELKKRAEKLAEDISNKTSGISVEIKDDFSQMGSGSLPEENIPTKVLCLKAEKITCDELEKKLRLNKTPIIARVKSDKVLLDIRTILEGEEMIIVDALKRVS